MFLGDMHDGDRLITGQATIVFQPLESEKTPAAINDLEAAAAFDHDQGLDQPDRSDRCGERCNVFIFSHVCTRIIFAN